MLEKLFEAIRFWISASDVPSGAIGTKKWPVRRSENAGGPEYDATAISGRLNTGDGSTEHDSPSGRVTRPVSARKTRDFSVHSSYARRMPSSVGAWSSFAS